ncbi:WD repeat-containing protein 74 [Lucilia cuprina]|uniref:WD repeat-containing protein 74 n=1 Tax=Lucilia cuprina TaxID=7375 RepID=UPI001F0669A1|nr:WD repeat-containing protein 74 [Lucilia cuprina]
MKWTTANVKNPNYIENHEIYVGTQTGSFKKLTPAYQENPFQQRNLQNLSELTKESRISSLAFGNENKSEILIGRHQKSVEVHSVRTDQQQYCIDFEHAPVVGLARFDNSIVAGFANGQLQCLPVNEEGVDTTLHGFSLDKVGDDMAHLRQCSVERNLVAIGGKGRQNNLKVLDMAAEGKQVFSSKNLPNDYLQLEVPVWDSDVGFIDSPHVLATCSRYGYVRVYDTRKQRRPVQLYATEDQMSFTALTARGNYIYTGTTMGAMKAFDIRRMKNFVHTYKGFTGGLSDVYLDVSGKHLVTACLDRYVRVHHADTCVLLYQCYVKSKASRVLLRESLENPNTNDNDKEAEDDDEDVDQRKSKQKKNKNSKAEESENEEYEDMFENMQTICDTEKDDDEEEDEDEEQKAEEKAEEETSKTDDSTDDSKKALKRKSSSKIVKNKKKKN